MLVAIRHEAFDRASLMREKCHHGAECKWCGQGARWFYWWVADDSPTTDPRYGIQLDPFCSVDCYRTYNA